MIKTLIKLQDLRRSIYRKAKAEPTWRFWGLYVHVCKMETLEESYKQCRSNNGTPGTDGVTFDEIEKKGRLAYLESIRRELVDKTYRPQGNRKVEIPKANGKMRIISKPSIKDRVEQNALKLILEPIFESDFQPGSYGSRPKKKKKKCSSSDIEYSQCNRKKANESNRYRLESLLRQHKTPHLIREAKQTNR